MSISSFIDFAKDYLAKHPPLHFFTGTQLVLILANGEEFAVREPRTSGTETSGGMEAHTVDQTCPLGLT
jgi:hypothetical protein